MDARGKCNCRKKGQLKTRTRAQKASPAVPTTAKSVSRPKNPGPVTRRQDFPTLYIYGKRCIAYPSEGRELHGCDKFPPTEDPEQQWPLY